MEIVNEQQAEADMCGNCGWWRAHVEPGRKARFGECDAPHVGQSTFLHPVGNVSMKVNVVQPITHSGTHCLHHRRVKK